MRRQRDSKGMFISEHGLRNHPLRKRLRPQSTKGLQEDSRGKEQTMRIIDADALIRRWCGMKCGCERDECGREIEPCIVVMAIEEAPTIKTKQIKYFDEDEKVWKTGEVIVDGEREGE